MDPSGGGSPLSRGRPSGARGASLVSRGRPSGATGCTSAGGDPGRVQAQEVALSGRAQSSVQWAVGSPGRMWTSTEAGVA